jgi:sulfoxide reductase heme-binding subunit YedZ
MNAITSSTALWYASRATGVVSLVQLTIVVVLGVGVQRQARLPGLPRFGVVGLHRSVSLLSVVFLAIHVGTAIADPYVSIRLLDAILPFGSSYEQFWLGLGAVGSDLIIALIATSLIRVRLGHRVWRWVHWLAYAAWPVAVAHGIGSSPDMQSGWLLGLAVLCVAAVAAAVAWRLAGRSRGVPRPARVDAVFAQIDRGRRQATAPSVNSGGR